jgi:cell division protein FtsI (penicillin-binding protein 3)
VKPAIARTHGTPRNGSQPRSNEPRRVPPKGSRSRTAGTTDPAGRTISRETGRRNGPQRSGTSTRGPERTSRRSSSGARHRAPMERTRQARSPRVSAPKPPRRSSFRVGSPRRRLIVALIVIASILLAIVVRVAFLQTTEADTLRSAGIDQWTRSVALPAQRGTVFDRYGNELAMSVPAATISINPKLVENGPATVQLLDDLLGLDDEKATELLAEIAAKDRGFVFVQRQADAAIGDQLSAMRLAGVNVDRESRREMPGGDTGRSVIGSTNIDGVGISGLELQYDGILTGTGGSLRREVAPGGRSIPGSETVTERPVSGQDLVLTLDRSIQFSTEQVLLEKVSEIGARGATAIVVDTDSGEIYAMASVRQDDTTGAYEVTSGNYAAVDAYEPGSVAKVITIASALSEGLVTPDKTYVVPWRKQYYDDLLKDSHEHPDETLTVSQILTESSNIGTIFVQQEMGRWKHRDYMAAFGLGEKTALDFPGESTGILKEADELWGSERVTVAYGQGVSSTSLQLVGAVNTIANDGVYVAPKLVKSTVGPDGTITDTPPSTTRRVVTEQAALQTTEMMRNVVCSGTATRAKVDGLSIAGKTGTAFKAADNGTYFDDNGERIYYASFVGFFPADDPQVTVLVSVDEPPSGTDDRFGGTAAAPVFAELAPTLIHELGIVPTPGAPTCEAG